MHQIHDFPLWLGHAGDGRDFKRLLDTGIAAVVQLAAEEPVVQLPRDLVYCRVPLLDGPGNDPRLLKLAMTTLLRCCNERLPTLVCCCGGMSRAPALVAVTLASMHGDPPQHWLSEIAQSQPCDVAPGLWNEIVSLAT